ncbi:neural cell adhesion molecule 1-A-like [Lutzomyia longipalpis]|uniref:neural cell adhesion molecule 1-A-like n=1 Tax=Lutzomyia longipalpis TaxID=7200 RepID=UPI002484498E|nr:neural cell adhesion molecule 1-A-like [Lutzomyia longipalpis]
MFGKTMKDTYRNCTSTMGFGMIVVFLAAFMCGVESHREKISLQPPLREVVRSVNDSYIVTCNAQNNAMAVRWQNPKKGSIKERRGRVHTEDIRDSLALVFEHITLADRGEWSCLGDDAEDTKSSFRMIVNEEMSFVDTPIVQLAREHRDATIRCEVKGDPEPVISWDYNGKSLQFPHEKYIKLADGLFIKRVHRNDSGEYTCRGFQVSPSIVNSKEQRIRLNVQYKPTLLSEDNIQYVYANGTVNLTCEAEAEPPANFSWFRHGKKINPRQQTIHTAKDISQLEITLTDASILGQYRCKASNPLGNVDHEILLKEGVKPEPPAKFILRGVSYDILDVDVGAAKQREPTEMDTIGYRFQIMPVNVFEEHDQDWTLARQIDFPVEDNFTYLITHLEPHTRYIVRVASRNLAGLSEYTDPKEFSTHSHGISKASTNRLASSLIIFFLNYALCHLN